VELRAVVAAPDVAVAAIEAAWGDGVAVAPVDPGAPPAARDRLLAALAPTQLLDGDGLRPLAGGEPVPAGTAAVLATSGTTGDPKAVVLGHAALEASARAVSAAVGTTPADRWLLCVPVHAVAGLSIVVRSRVAGCGLEVHRRFDVGAVVEAAGRCTLVSLVPTTLRRLLDDRAGGAALTRFRVVLLGGGPIPADLLTAARATGVTVHTTYGLTETCGGVVHDGHPLAGVELGTGPYDEILVRGPMLCSGYRGTGYRGTGYRGTGPGPASPTSPVDADGWLHTGDAGHVDASGTLWVTDRLGDLVITGGVNVSPTAVERALAHVPGVGAVAVAGVADPEWGERVVAWVVPAGEPPSLDALRAAATAALGPAHAPRQLVLVDALPLSPAGKLRRRDLVAPSDGGPPGRR
jgi:O-succinylbenzoic acid--CoA ligase